jgi:hypothetical protein
MYVGSDDGLVGKNISEALSQLEKNEKEADIFHFRSLGFTYPIMGRKPWVEVPTNFPSGKLFEMKSPKLLCSLFPTQLNALLPIPYGSAICKKLLLNEFLEGDQGFPGIAPDYFLGFYLAILRKRQVFMDFCLPIRGLSVNSNGYQVLNGIDTDNSRNFHADVKERNQTEITSGALKCRPGIAVQDYLLAKRLVKGRDRKLCGKLALKLAYLTCIDSGHHVGKFHQYTLKVRKFFINKLGYFLRKAYFRAAGIDTGKIRNSRVDLEYESTIFSAQSEFTGKC